MEKEISLLDYLKTILKRKNLIIVLTLGSMVMAGVFTYLIPKTYKISTVLEVGKIDGQTIDAPLSVAEKIIQGVYGGYPEVQVDNLESLSAKSTASGSINFITIALTSSEVEEGKEIINNVVESILDEHQTEFDKKIAWLQEDITRAEEGLEFLKYRKIYADSGIYQFHIYLSNTIDKINNSYMTEIIRPITVSKDPFSPKPLLNIMIAGVLGLCMGVFLAFIIEAWQNYNISESERSRRV